ncbi:Lipoprotein release ABC-type transport system, LolE-like permease protein [hydrothermal vent metagenome]|uniref:Lipoprotein release ABC-type transport system, LolE-like permease protein n=1 Tax=hydrothermal vent metagenome TaxID=652676 RepID=A0A3B1CP00_9ZZZZ
MGINIFSFAFRNVGRNKSRTLITVGAMAFAGGLMILYASLMEGMLTTFERNAVGMSVGEMQLHAPGYRENPDLYKKISGVDDIIARLNTQGFEAAMRLYGFGLAAAGANSSGVTLRGVDMKRETQVTQLYRHMLKGSWLDEADPKGVVIGRKLARTLGIWLGDEVIIVSQAADGSMANDLYNVKGILKSVGEMIDRSGFFMTENAFRELMGVASGAHEIAIVRRNINEKLSAAIKKVSAVAPNAEAKTWRELMPVIAKMLDTNQAGVFIMLLITYTAIGMVTLNAMLMNVFERIREFGVMKAIGVTPWQIISIIFAEAMIQAFFACVIALILGVSLSLYFQTHGIDLSTIAGSSLANIGGVAFDPVWKSRVTANSVLTPIAVLVGIVALAVIYPGVKAAVIRPVEAIHHI